MKFYFDTEFLEGKQPKKLFGLTYGYTKPTIDLISLGMVAEDGREFFALSNEFNLALAWNRSDGLDKNGRPKYWIRDNVLLPIYQRYVSGEMRNRLDFSQGTMRYLMDTYGKSNLEIAELVAMFVGGCSTDTNDDGLCSYCHNKGGCVNKPEFYAYFADYDWVVFCQLFGRMLDLPKNFPYYCKDLKQMLDDKVAGLDLTTDGISIGYPDTMPNRLVRVATFEEKLVYVKQSPYYPKQTNEHCALADAKWNRELHKFIINFK